MRRELKIASDPIDETALLQTRRMDVEMGAVIYFVGVVRGTEDGKPISGIDYEAFVEMARRQFNLIFDQAEKRWPLESVRLVHRTGWVAVGEASLWVETVAPHRGEAFAATQFIIEEMKRLAPIWKKPSLV